MLIKITLRSDLPLKVAGQAHFSLRVKVATRNWNMRTILIWTAEFLFLYLNLFDCISIIWKDSMTPGIHENRLAIVEVLWSKKWSNPGYEFPSISIAQLLPYKNILRNRKVHGISLNARLVEWFLGEARPCTQWEFDIITFQRSLSEIQRTVYLISPVTPLTRDLQKTIILINNSWS